MVPHQPFPNTILREREPGSWEKCDLESIRENVNLWRAIAFHQACGNPADQVVQMNHFIFIW